MRISNSKKQLASIISENGGWIKGNYAIQDKDDKCIWFMFKLEGRPQGRAAWPGFKSNRISCDKVLQNWHQTILSREEYLHLYPATDSDGWIEWSGGECPVGEDVVVEIKTRDGEIQLDQAYGWNWGHEEGSPVKDRQIIAYRINKPEQAKPECCESVMRSIPEPAAKPSIEQLAAEYRNAKDCAQRKQQEADEAKADADARLKALELAGEALGLLVSPITKKQGPELVITDWRDLQVGDEIEMIGDGWCRDRIGKIGVVRRVESDGYAGDLPILCDIDVEDSDWGLGFKFIRRP